jgi:hypothetical protein
MEQQQTHAPETTEGTAFRLPQLRNGWDRRDDLEQQAALHTLLENSALRARSKEVREARRLRLLGSALLKVYRYLPPVMFSLAFLTAWSHEQALPDILPFLLAMGSILAAIWAGSAGEAALQASMKATARLLRPGADLADKRFLCELVEALELPNTMVQVFLMETLAPLLRQLTAADARLLNHAQKAILYRFIADEERPMRNYAAYIPRYAEFTLATLKALEQIGDESAIPHVERLADTSTYQHIRAAARECLPYLYARQENAHQSLSLLRASGAPGAASEELLRAASGTTPSDPAQLLRASADSPELPAPFPDRSILAREGGEAKHE